MLASMMFGGTETWDWDDEGMESLDDQEEVFRW
jgi:hypothetical protein